jgi:hypothetical protein
MPKPPGPILKRVLRAPAALYAVGAVEIAIARMRFRPEARRLDPEEAIQALADYQQRNRAIAPLVRALLSAAAGFRYDGSPSAQRTLVGRLPFVAFRSRDKYQPVR